ncbi:helix-turn-helix domain-containing protein [Candidatus Omnitrophota bacterium]
MLLGTRIKQERINKGLKLRQVEKRTGLNIATLSQIEQGRLNPTPDELLKITRCIEKEPSKFYKWIRKNE